MIVYRKENECQENLIETYSTVVFKAKVTKIDMQMVPHTIYKGEKNLKGSQFLWLRTFATWS